MSAPEPIVIESSELALAVSPVGAEMQSVVCDGTERLWCADAAVWGRHAPLLFPLIGRLRDGYYELDGQRIDAPTHGFCRDRLFAVEARDGASVRFATCDDENTRAVYPFAFCLEVGYAVEGSTITKTLRVANTGDAPMPFEIGGHEAYATCLEPGETMADYFVTFGSASTRTIGDEEPSGNSAQTSEDSTGEPVLDRIEMFAMDADGILGLPKIAVPLEGGRLTRTPEQLDIDTIVLENVPGSTATLASAKSGRAVTVDFPGFPYLGIWTKPMGDATRYLCLEPWSALPDAHFSPRELARKHGVRTVAPGQTCELSYRMTFR